MLTFAKTIMSKVYPTIFYNSGVISKISDVRKLIVIPEMFILLYMQQFQISPNFKSQLVLARENDLKKLSFSNSFWQQFFLPCVCVLKEKNICYT